MILSTMQEATIQEMLEYNQENSWNFVFSRNLKDEEIEDVAHSLDLISIFRRGDAEDYRVWQNGNKSFSVKECYKDLEVQGLIYFPYKCVWNPKIPQKVVFFVWNLCFVAAPTMYTYKNSIMVNGCLLCKKEQRLIIIFFCTVILPESFGSFCCQVTISNGCFKSQSETQVGSGKERKVQSAV